MDIIVFDTETTGLSVRQGDRIIEIGAVKLSKGEIVAEFNSLINTSVPISPHAQAVHGINRSMLRGHPEAEQVFGEFRDFIGDAPLVAHNAPFDMSFLHAEFGRLGFDLDNPSFCTLQLARKKYPRLNSYKLEQVARYLFGELGDLNCHRALDDAQLAARVWLRLTT